MQGGHIIPPYLGGHPTPSHTSIHGPGRRKCGHEPPREQQLPCSEPEHGMNREDKCEKRGKQTAEGFGIECFTNHSKGGRWDRKPRRRWYQSHREWGPNAIQGDDGIINPQQHIVRHIMYCNCSPSLQLPMDDVTD